MLSPSNRKVFLLPLTLILTTHVAAQNITASTCIAPSAFTQCYNQQSSFYETCITSANGNTDEILACGCTLQLGELICAMTDCWNVVYGCEYQSVANAYASYCSTPVPYFPAPDNAPGGCSCNLGYVLFNFTDAVLENKDCVGSDVDQNEGCECCEQAAGYAALYGICPDTSPAYLAYVDAETLLQVGDVSLEDGQCSSALAAYNCNSLGFTSFGVPFMTSVNSATFGTQSLSNTNTKTLTSPASGATFVWSNLNTAFTIVAASAGVQVSGGGASSSNGKGSTTAAATTRSEVTGSSTGGAQSTSSAKSGAHRSVSARMGLLWCGLAIGVASALV